MISRGDDSYLLKADSLEARYGSRIVFRDANIRLHVGELVGLVGPNGSGKSTLLHTLTGYHSAASGSITISGRPLSNLSRREIARNIAFMPQRTESQFDFTAREMVLMGRHPYAGYGFEDKSEDLMHVRQAMENLEIIHLADRSYNGLSGGEQQLVLLARTFAQQAPVLLLDEPLTGLDLAHQYTLMKALQTQIAGGTRAVLATFHDLSLAARWCSRLIMLGHGRVMADGSPKDVITPENLAASYRVAATVRHHHNGNLDIEVSGIAP